MFTKKIWKSVSMPGFEPSQLSFAAYPFYQHVPNLLDYSWIIVATMFTKKIWKSVFTPGFEPSQLLFAEYPFYHCANVGRSFLDDSRNNVY